MNNSVQQEQYPGLAGLDFARRWMDGFTAVFENLLVSLSSILLTIGIGVSMYDFFTGGQALNNSYLMNGWATIQTLAVDTQFIVMWYRCKLAIKNRNYIAAFGYALLGSALGFVVFTTNAIPSLQLATHQDFNSSIAALGFDAASIVWIRSAVLVVLAIIAAFNRTVITFSQDGTKTVGSELVKLKIKEPKKTPETKPVTNDERLSWLKKKWLKVQENRRVKKSKKDEAKQAQKQPHSPVLSEQNSEQKIEKNTEELLPVSRNNRNTKPLEELPEIEIKTDPEFEAIPQEKPVKNRSEKSRIGLTFSEAARLKICRENEVKSSDIRAAVLSGKIIKKSDGTVAKSAVESWARTFRKSQVEQAS